MGCPILRTTNKKDTANHNDLQRLYVIRTGFEPVTHSLEGCCSIQLSYRTSPFNVCSGLIRFSKRGCKCSDFFLICNNLTQDYFFEAIFPMTSMLVTRLKPIRAKMTAEKICGSIIEACAATATSSAASAAAAPTPLSMASSAAS